MKKCKDIAPETNPLTSDLIIEVTQIVDGSKMRVGINGVMQPDVYKVEQQEYTKVFHAPGAKKLILELSDPALRLFNYIIYTMEPGQDLFKMNQVYYMRLCNIRSNTTFRKALFELTDMGIIEKSEDKEYYFINPAIAYNGDRPRKYPDKVHVTHTIKKR